MPEPITVGQLRNLLCRFPADMPITISVWVRRNTRWYLGEYTQSAHLDELYLTAMPGGGGGSIPREGREPDA